MNKKYMLAVTRNNKVETVCLYRNQAEVADVIERWLRASHRNEYTDSQIFEIGNTVRTGEYSWYYLNLKDGKTIYNVTSVSV